jgi:hypothetical protein
MGLFQKIARIIEQYFMIFKKFPDSGAIYNNMEIGKAFKMCCDHIDIMQKYFRESNFMNYFNKITITPYFSHISARKKNISNSFEKYIKKYQQYNIYQLLDYFAHVNLRLPDKNEWRLYQRYLSLKINAADNIGKFSNLIIIQDLKNYINIDDCIRLIDRYGKVPAVDTIFNNLPIGDIYYFTIKADISIFIGKFTSSEIIADLNNYLSIRDYIKVLNQLKKVPFSNEIYHNILIGKFYCKYAQRYIDQITNSILIEDLKKYMTIENCLNDFNMLNVLPESSIYNDIQKNAAKYIGYFTNKIIIDNLNLYLKLDDYIKLIDEYGQVPEINTIYKNAYIGEVYHFNIIINAAELYYRFKNQNIVADIMKYV